MHGSGWWAYISHDEKADKPQISKELLWRVWDFAQPYRLQVILMFVTILMITCIIIHTVYT